MSRPIMEMRGLLVVRNNMPTLDVPRLEIEEGSIVSIVGPNGAGKSTLLLSLMGLVRPDSGEVLFRGEPVRPDSSAHRHRRKMAMVFQEPLLFSTSVYNNVASGLKLRGMRKDDVRPAVNRSMELLGISRLAKRRAGALSGGEAQRVNLARALAVEPELILMDEPFSSLDAPSREGLIEDIERIIRGRKITALFATHDRGEAIRLSDRVLVMNAGRIVQSGTPREVTMYPADEFVASFMGTETILTGTVTGSDGGGFTAAVNGMAVEGVGQAEPGAAVTFCLHPENIVLSLERPESSARNMFSGRVARVVPAGLFQKVFVDCGFTLVAYVTNRSIEEMGIREGLAVNASFKATSVHVIKTVRAM
ncbi:MAG: ABC transporter ATP-binding protein [Spirochaetes bacterium]|nr:ABC transporter ATP-binding protein [Spirochaetota bacterium]